MQDLINQISSVGVKVVGQLLLALLVFIVGKAIIKKLLKVLENKALSKGDPTLRKFMLSFAKILLYVVLVVSIIGILGVPMASVVTVLASAGVAVGMAMQGSLSNLAGGIMLMIFKPFKVGDYVSAAGGEGTVKEISMFYTVLTTVDNKTITIPNGSLMNANVVNFSAEDLRRVDLEFACAKSEDIDKVTDIMLKVMNGNEKVLKDPTPFAAMNGGSNEATKFTVRAWVKGGDYWDVYFALNHDIAKKLGENGIKAPAVRIVND